MGDKSKIEWLRGPDGREGASWNVVRGCTRVSPGCENCYAIQVAHRFGRPGQWGEGLTRIRESRPHVDWSGEIRYVRDNLDQPLRWQRPRRVFVCSTSDLFHHAVDGGYIAAVFGIMAAAQNHTFLVLTKRSERMRDWFGQISTERDPVLTCMDAAGARVFRALSVVDPVWPLPNVHVGVSAETQDLYDKRVADLLQVPAAIRWVSIEPQLGPVSMVSRSLPDWIVTGGESGTRARSYDLAWPEALIREGREHGVPVFVKQLGGNPIAKGRPWPAGPRLTGKGANPREWPPGLRVQEYPG